MPEDRRLVLEFTAEENVMLPVWSRRIAPILARRIAEIMANLKRQGSSVLVA